MGQIEMNVPKTYLKAPISTASVVITMEGNSRLSGKNPSIFINTKGFQWKKQDTIVYLKIMQHNSLPELMTNFEDD